MKKCAADDHPFCTHRVQEGEPVCAVGHLQKLPPTDSYVGRKSVASFDIDCKSAEGAALFRPTLPATPGEAHSPLPTYAELTTRTAESTATGGLHLHFSGYDPRAAGGRQILRLELRGGVGQVPLQSIAQIEVQLRSDLISPSLSEHRFLRTLSGQWRPLLIAFSSKNKEYGQYQIEVVLTHMIEDTCQRRWTCSTIILVPPTDTSLTEIHRVFLASHKNVKVLADDGSIAKLSGLNGYAHGNMDIEISAKNAALTQVELSAPMGKCEIAMGTIAWDEELIEEAIQEPLDASITIAPSKVINKTIAASPLNSQFQTSTTTSASLISKTAQIRLLALDEWILGRLELQRPSADILLAHSAHSVTENAKLTRRISARHAIIRRVGAGAEIIDVSRYGVLLDGVALEKDRPTPLQSGMRIEFCASVKGIACLHVIAILPHLIILQRFDTKECTEFFYLITPETKPDHLLQSLPGDLPQLFHFDGNFWHLDPGTKQESSLGSAARLSALHKTLRDNRYFSEAYKDLHVRGYGVWRVNPTAPSIAS